MPYIIATIYEFFNCNATLIMRAIPPHQRSRWTSLARRWLLCLCGKQENESNECFRPHIVWYFLISAHIILYCHKKFEHHLGTKAPKITVVFSSLTGENFIICKDFHGTRLFDSKKSNTIFYNGIHSIHFFYFYLFSVIPCGRPSFFTVWTAMDFSPLPLLIF